MFAWKQFRDIMDNKIHVTFHSESILEELSARQLFSGGIEGILAVDNTVDVATHQEHVPSSSNIETINSDLAVSMQQELVFIDTDVDNYQQLLNDILSQDTATERNIEVVLLDNQHDGIAQISQALSNYQNLDAVHIISHGEDGSIDIGNTLLDSNTLNQNLSEISAWGDSFSEHGDFLIYGCNLAATDSGQSLVQALSSLTHTDVAASDDLTGHDSLNADWDLEYQTGLIEAETAVSLDVQNEWTNTLVAAPTDLSFGMDTSAETLVNTVTAGGQQHPSVAILSDGGHVVIWRGGYNQDSDPYDTYGQIFDVNGNTVGAEFIVTTTAGSQSNAVVAGTADGGFIVAYESAHEGSTSIYVQAFDSTGNKVGPTEFRAPTNTSSTQQATDIAAFDDGGYIITWTSDNGQDGHYDGVYAQRFDASHNKVGSETQVNTHTTYDQKNSKVTAFSDGSYTITWTSNNQLSKYDEVYGQQFNSDGSTKGSEFLINTTIENSQFDSSITTLDNDRFIVTWRESSSMEISAQVFDRNGDKVGGEILVNTYTVDNKSDPQVTKTSDGGFLISWTSSLQDGDLYGLHAQRFDAAGNTIGDEFQLADSTVSYQRHVSLATFNDGRVIASFVSPDSNYDGIYTKIFTFYSVNENTTNGTVIDTVTVTDPDVGDTHTFAITADSSAGAFQIDANSGEVSLLDGSKINFQTITSVDITVEVTDSGGLTFSKVLNIAVEKGNEAPTDLNMGMDATSDTLVNTYTASSQDRSDVASLAGGGYVIIWRGAYNQDGNSYGVYGQQFDVNGNMVGVEFLVNTTTAGAQSPGQVAGTADGGFVVTFTSDHEGTTSVYAQAFDSAGNKVGPTEFRVPTNTTTVQQLPDIASFDDGGYIITWTSEGHQDSHGTGVYAQRFDASHNEVGSETQVNTHTTYDQMDSKVTTFSDGSYTITWQSNYQLSKAYEVYGQQFNSDGSTKGSEFLINTTIDNSQYDPSIATLDNDRFIVTWSESLGAEISAQIFNINGDKVGGEILVNTYTLDTKLTPTVTSITDGGFLISWNSTLQDGDFYGIHAQRFDATGNKISEEFQLSDNTAGFQKDVSLTSLNDGRVVASFTSPDASSSGIYTKTFTFYSVDENAANGTVIDTVTVTDPDVGDIHTFAITADTSGGAFQIDANSGEVSVLDGSKIDFEVASSFDITVEVTDSGGLTYSKTLNIAVANVNEAVTAVDDVDSTNEDIDLNNINVLSNDTDIDGDTLSVTLASATNGTVSINGDGTLNYTPDADFNGTDTITYTVSDGSLTDTGTLTITVNAVNDAPTFGASATNGIITTDLSGGKDVATTTVIQDDGKLLVSGYRDSDKHLTLSRYHSNGSLDLSFGSNGTGTIDSGLTTFDYANNLVIQSDGMIVIAGTSSDNFVLQRYDTNGDLDLSFGTAGSVTTTTATTDAAFVLAIQADGKLVVSGLSSGSTTIHRYDTNGDLDTSFSLDGKVFFNEDFSPTQTSIAIQDDGKLLISGYSFNSTSDGFLLRYNSDGSLDTGFGADLDGTITIDNGSHDFITDVILQGNNILVAGSDFPGDIILSRYDADGLLDLSFGSAGSVTPDLGMNIGLESVVLQSDGKLIIAGQNDTDFVLIRYDADGALDTTFGTLGILTTDVGLSDRSRDITIQPDDKLLVVGDADNDFALIRYNSDGSLDASFDGSSLNGNPTFIEGGSAVVLDNDVQIFDAELSVADNFDGATLTLERTTTASADDVFSATANLAALTEGGVLSISATTIGTVTTNSAGTLVLTFNNAATQALVNETLQSIAYSNSSDNPAATVQIDWTFNDGNSGAQGAGGALEATGSTTVNITGVNDAPVAVDDTGSTNEDVDLNSINVLSNDTDVENDALSVTLASALNGTVSINGDNTLNYSPDADFNGTDTITYTVSDGDLTDTGTVTITVYAVNDQPVNTVSVAQTVDEDSTLVFNAANSNLISISDIDIAAGLMEVALNVDNGILSLSGITGLTIIAGSDDSSTVTIKGTLADINSALDGLSYTPTSDYSGNDTLTISSVDSELISLNIDAAFTAHYTFDNNAVPGEDSSSAGIYDGVLFGDATTTTDATRGEVLSLDGTDDYVEIAGLFGEPASITLAAWVNLSGEDLAGASIISLSSSINLKYDGGSFIIEYATGTGTVLLSHTAPINPIGDGWHHIASSFDDTSKTFTLFVDGVAYNSSTVITSINYSGGNTRIGAYTLHPFSDFSGLIDDVRIYDRALTVTEIGALAHDLDVSSDTVSITVNAVVDIAADAITTDEDTAITSNVLTNDSFEGTPVITAVTNGTNGTVSIVDANTGTVSYTPDADFNGVDSYTYTITSGGVTETATVSVTVNAIDDAVTLGGNTSGTGSEDGAAITGTLTATDLKDGLIDGSIFTVSSAASNGVASIDAASGAWTYTANADYNGLDAFTVTITDDDGHTATQVISLTVNAVVDIAADAITTDEDTAITSNVLSNDEFEGTPVITAVTDGSNGTVSIVDANTGTVSYTPDADFNGVDSYTYTITSGGVTETATVSVTVNAIDDAVTLGGNTSGTGTEDGAAITGTLTAVDVADGLTDGTIFTVSSLASNGVASIDAATGAWTYTANADYNGLDAFTVTITDDDGHTATQIISLTVTPVNDAPIAVNDIASTNEDIDLNNINVLGNDSDIEADSLSVTLASAINGMVSINPDNTLNYSPNANFNGTDTITYTVSDGNLTDMASVTITVNAVNDAPTIQSTINTQSLSEDFSSYTVDLTAAFADIETTDANLSYSTSGNSNINVSIVNGIATIGTTADWHGSENITFIATDEGGLSVNKMVAFDVSPIKDVHADHNILVVEDMPTIIAVLANDSFAGTPTLNITSFPAGGVVSVNADNTLTYTPDNNYTGGDGFVYSATSGGVTEYATVTIDFIAVTDLTAVDDSFTMDEDNVLNESVAVNDSTTSGGLLSYSKTSNPSSGNVVFNDDGTFSYLPNANFNGSDSFTYTVTDANSRETSTRTVSITINPINDAPVARDDFITTDQNISINSINVLANDSDIDGDPLSVMTANALFGTVTINANNTLNYTPLSGFSGSDTIIYTIDDGQGETASTNIYVTVDPIILEEVTVISDIAKPPSPIQVPEPIVELPTIEEPIVESRVEQVAITPDLAPTLVEKEGYSLEADLDILNNALSNTPTVNLQESVSKVNEVILGSNNDALQLESSNTTLLHDSQQKESSNDEPESNHTISSVFNSNNSQISEVLWENVNLMRAQMDEDLEQSEHNSLEIEFVAGATTVSFAAGFVSWILRGGALLSSLLSSVSVFNKFDPLAVVQNSNAAKSSSKTKDGKVDSMFGTKK